jgi:hypothetical protein
VVLFDEYDKPLTDTLDNPELNEQNKETVREIFSVLKGSDKYIKFSLLTGVTKFSKVSLFSGVNHLKDISLDKRYATICGITQEELENNFKFEIEEMAKTQDETNDTTLIKLKEEYNGYFFNENGPSVYNPYSTIKVLDEMKYNDYWFESGTTAFLMSQLKNFDYETFDLEDDIPVTQNDIQDYRPESPNPVPLLFQTGYLTIKDFDKYGRVYILGFPNNEVRRGFAENLFTYFNSALPGTTSYDYVKYHADLNDGDLDAFFDRLASYFADYPYDTTGGYEERDYQGIIYTLFTLLGHIAYVEKRGSLGRADVVVEMRKYVYIFELKVDKAGKPESKIDEALAQIEEKGYAVPFEKDPDETRTIRKVAVVFDLDNRNLKAWKATEAGAVIGQSA